MVPYSALTDYDRSVVLVLDDRPDPHLWVHCRSTHNSSMIWFLCLQWFLCGILADNAACHREAIAVQLACGDLRCPHGL